MEMDLEEKLVMGKNTIDILIGNFITSDSLKNNSCGFSKINLYIIEMPQMEISMKLYKYKIGKKMDKLFILMMIIAQQMVMKFMLGLIYRIIQINIH